MDGRTTICATPPPLLGEEDQSSGPLGVEDFQQVSAAAVIARKITRAGNIAAFNGWTLGIVAGFSLMFAFSSIMSLVMGVTLGLIAVNEFRGRRMIRRFDLRAPQLLGWNQIALIIVLVGYSLWNIHMAMIEPNQLAADLAAAGVGANALADSIGDIFVKAKIAAYVSLIILSVIFQGINAAYYFSRATHLRAYLNGTAPWIVDLHRSGSVA